MMHCYSPTLRAVSFLIFLSGFSTSVFAQTRDLFISSRTSNSVIQFDGQTGAYVQDFVESGDGGLSAPQEVIWHPDGSLLVTGRWNDAIKRYDGVTGDYIEDFTNGYTLDQPTKTTISPDSTYLYVSQWSSTQNKVVRFDFQTGAYIDEFTDQGVVNGMGHTWDSAGNMYVVRWGLNGNDGDVRVFDSNGVFQQVLIPTGDVQGPVNIWTGDSSDLFVVDWTLGQVREFDISGQLEGIRASGMSTAEGFVFDDNGMLLICDWSANNVRRYNLSTGSFSIFIAGGGLGNPNSIAYGPEYIVSVEGYEHEETFLQLYPNPVEANAQFTVDLQAGTTAQIQVFDMTGRVVELLDYEAIFNGKQIVNFETAHLTAGSYTAQVIADGKSVTIHFVKL